jgi:tRNA (guanine37-N1)-methyltransferase
MASSSEGPPPLSPSIESPALESTAPSLRVGIISLFPELFETFLATSLVGKAVATGLVGVQLFQLREQGLGNHRSVDDTPYGGGSGMVLRVDCVVSAIEAAERALGAPAHRVLLTPQGQPFRAPAARQLAQRGCILLVCGRYEGFDERVRSYVHEEISLGDFVLTGGEIPAMAVIEAAVRFLPGVLGNHTSSAEESFSELMSGGLEYPQYTRPPEFRGARVPDVLTSGDHAKIAAYRAEESARRTRVRRPDLCEDD